MVHTPVVDSITTHLKAFSFATIFCFIFIGGAKGQFWTETFGADMLPCESQASDITTAVTDNGFWTVANTGASGFISNAWFISSQEQGGFDPLVQPCGARCNQMTNPATNRTLHIGVNSFNPFPDAGATYVSFASPGAYETNLRAESPEIDFTGNFNNTIAFNYAAQSNANDFATLVYFDGTAWNDLAVLPGNGICGPASISWTAFSMMLPAGANNQAGVKIGFRWTNDSDGNTSTVSIAVDDITITAGPPPAVPTAIIEVVDGNDTFCETNCTSFSAATSTFDMDFSEGLASAAYLWTFEGGTPATSDQANPQVCYDTPGTYDVTLVVTDNIGSSMPAVSTNLITVEDCGPDITISANRQVACANEQCVDFTDLSVTDHPGGITDWLWTFTSPTMVQTTSTLQNPTNICLNEIGSYDVTLAATDADLTETETFPAYIQVIDCSGPDIEFSANRLVLCPGGCIELTDMSTSNGSITSWNWSLPGGQAVGESVAGSSSQQNPTVCYATAGSYMITLSATDQEGPSAITKTITITVDPCTGPPQVGIGASQYQICTGDCIDFVDQSLGLVDEYLWVFQGTANINQATSTEKNPSVICYSQPGTYNVTLTVSNSNGQIDSQTFVDTITVSQCVNKPVPRIAFEQDTICAGDCIDFMDASTGVGISAWQWNFEGAVAGSGTSNVKNPPGVCYNQTGSFDVSLRVSGSAGDSTRVFRDAVVVVSTPECRPTVEVNAPDTLCAGACAEFAAVFEKADSVRWTFNGGNPASSTARNPGIVCYEEEGNYLVFVEAFNPSGAASPTFINLFVGERPELNAGPDRNINAGAVIELKATVGETEPSGEFLWQPFDLVDDFSASTVTTSPNESTTYVVYYSEPGTCTAVDSVHVNVRFIAAVGVPSAFSPNGDGQNDELRVLGQGIARMEFKIFNRYGQLVFESTRQERGWDGLHNGKELDPGTFVYTLEVTFAEGQRDVYTGNVTLMK